MSCEGSPTNLGALSQPGFGNVNSINWKLKGMNGPPSIVDGGAKTKFPTAHDPLVALAQEPDDHDAAMRKYRLEV